MKDENKSGQIQPALTSGDENCELRELFPLVLRELRQIAHAHLRKEIAGHTLQTTALINEAYLKLLKQENTLWQNRTHFLAIASKIMRRILLDYAKQHLREKRGGGAAHVEFDEAAMMSKEKSAQLIALDDVLNQLAKIDPLKSRIVEMRHFGGMTVEETAEELKIAPVTVMRHWNLAKVWLKREISGE